MREPRTFFNANLDLRTAQLAPDVRAKINLQAATQEALRKSAQEAANRAGAAVNTVESAPIVLVFAPPGGTEQRAVQGVATALEQNGFSLGRKRIFPGKAPNGITEVRFFRNPEDRDEAARILAILKSSAHLSDGRISYVIDPDIKRSRYFEVRLAKTAFASR